MFKNFLLLDEKDDEMIDVATKNGVEIPVDIRKNDNKVQDDNVQNLKHDEISIIVSNATAKWTVDQSINAIDLIVKSGQLVTIIGSVGAGKVRTDFTDIYYIQNDAFDVQRSLFFF